VSRIVIVAAMLIGIKKTETFTAVLFKNNTEHVKSTNKTIPPTLKGE
jgi:hypothetical protein